MRRLKALLVPVLLLAMLPLASAASSSSRTCPTVKTPKLSFGKKIFIDEMRAGGEPVSQVAQDGSIIVSAHAGTTHVYKDPQAGPGAGDFARYYNQTLNWRSTDGGKTWNYIGLFGAPEGPHTATSTGFSDPDLTMDAGGRIYNVEIDLANVAVFSSSDDGQSWPRGNPIAASGDRPWVTAAEADEVFLYVNLPRQLWRSTNGGLTFSLVTTSLPANSKLLVDPLKPKTGLIGPAGTSGIAISPDDGVTWKEYPGALGKSTQFFGAVAVDRAGWIYSAAAGGYDGSNDTKSDGEVTYNYFNRQTNKWSPRAITIPNGGRDALWPWLIAGDEGRLAITWYERIPETDEFHIMVAQTLNAHGSYVRCSDGSRQFVPPHFSVANASKGPIHIGKICLSGTSCNANSSFENGDRRLGDFFTVNFDHKGNLFVVSGDTTLPNPVGGPKPVANPIFIKQKGGAPMLEKPDKVRDPRPLCATPNC